MHRVQLNALVARSEEEMSTLGKVKEGRGMYHLASDEECRSMVVTMNETHTATTLDTTLIRRGKHRDCISLS